MTVQDLMLLIGAAEEKYKALDAEYVEVCRQIEAVNKLLANLPLDKEPNAERIEADREGMMLHRKNIMCRRAELADAIHAARTHQI